MLAGWNCSDTVDLKKPRNSNYNFKYYSKYYLILSKTLDGIAMPSVS